MTPTRNEDIMDLLKQYQNYIAFLKMPPEKNYDEEKVGIRNIGLIWKHVTHQQHFTIVKIQRIIYQKSIK